MKIPTPAEIATQCREDAPKRFGTYEAGARAAMLAIAKALREEEKRLEGVEGNTAAVERMTLHNSALEIEQAAAAEDP